MKTKRELFEDWVGRETGWDLYWSDAIQQYMDHQTNAAWLAWQESASREGFVLVPVETIRECLSWCDVAKWDSPSKIRDEEIHRHEGVILEVLGENQD